ncbi:MAG: hypothetical protein JWM80_3154 [Cyanobacteria bacterium RYN_339]|nr:hypothetical protein [Cyanobacteria bacterium RYN_339]
MRQIMLFALLALTGCDQLPIGSVIGQVTGSSTLHGQVAGATDKTRVGLLAQPQGKGRVELTSTSASGGSFALALNTPPITMLEQPAEDKSYVFVLTAYDDVNGNGRYDDGPDRTRDTMTGGSYRWFANPGPSNSMGWNVYKDGVYSSAGDVTASL